MEPLCCSVNDAAKALSLCRASIYNLINDGKLATQKVGRRRLVRIESVRQLADVA